MNDTHLLCTSADILCTLCTLSRLLQPAREGQACDLLEPTLASLCDWADARQAAVLISLTCKRGRSIGACIARMPELWYKRHQVAY